MGINKITTKEYKYRPFYMAEKTYQKIKKMKDKGKFKSYNELFEKLIKKNINKVLDN